MAGKARPGVDECGRTPLHYAAVDRDIEGLRIQLREGADPNAPDDSGWSPLHFAAQAASIEATSILLDAGADVHIRDNRGNTALFRAVFSSRGEGGVVGLLRAAGADPRAVNNAGVTPLGLARRIANFDTARFFSDLP